MEFMCFGFLTFYSTNFGIGHCRWRIELTNDQLIDELTTG